MRGVRDQRPAVELRRAHPVHRVDHRLARERRALLAHDVRHSLAGDGQQYHVGVFQRVADASHRRPAWAFARAVPGPVDHVMPGRAPLAPERSADLTLADHRYPHGRQQPV